jgi:hypothetical protein
MPHCSILLSSSTIHKRPARFAVFADALFNWHLIASCPARFLNGRVANSDVGGDGAV